LSWKEQICHQPNLFYRIKRDKQAAQVQRIRQAFGLRKTSWKPPLIPSPIRQNQANCVRRKLALKQ
jgi:hypothetical protein